MNSTIRSNVTVGPPVELLIYERDSLNEGRKMVLTEDDPFAKAIAEKWNEGLLLALTSLPRFDWEEQQADHSAEGQVYNFPASP
jgi:putative proteasome-type protease